MKNFRLHGVSPKRNQGFSLVEVTLAIGITAVALVSLMGMLPKGMQTLQRANDLAVMGRIHQQILGELQMTPWESTMGGGSPIESFDQAVRYYDDQGIELASSDRGGFSHVYTARVSIPREGEGVPISVGGGSHGGVKVPGESALPSGTPVDYMRLVIVEVTGIADPNFLNSVPDAFDNPDLKDSIRTYRTLVAKMGQEYESN